MVQKWFKDHLNNAKNVREIASRLFKQNLKLIFEYLKHGLKNRIKMT